MHRETRMALQRELQRWPSVTAEFCGRSKHGCIVVRFREQRRMVVSAATPSDYRAMKNTVRDLRKVLREMGAEPLNRNERMHR